MNVSVLPRGRKGLGSAILMVALVFFPQGLFPGLAGLWGKKKEIV